MRKILFAAVLAMIAISVVFAAMQNREWVVPEEAKKQTNPLQPSEAALRAAKEIYLDNCAQCHGETGKGDGPEAAQHDPRPANLQDAKHMDTVSDGELFYQISEGRQPMPAFKKRLTQEQRWQLVLLVRSFSAPAVTQPKK